MKYVVEANCLVNKFLSLIRNIIELMNSTFKKQLLKLTENLRQLKLAQNVSKQLKKLNESIWAIFFRDRLFINTYLLFLYNDLIIY